MKLKTNLINYTICYINERKHQKNFFVSAIPLSLQIVSTNQPVKQQTVTVDDRFVTALLADITTLNVDVIVNAANSLMNHEGGLAKDIVSKGDFEK